MAGLITGIEVETVRAGASACAAEIADAARKAGRDPAEVELLAAVKYIALEELGVLAEAGLTLLGENRAQELEAKAAGVSRTSAGTSSASSRAARSSRSSRTPS